MGYPREAHKMLTGSAVTLMSLIRTPDPKDQTSKPWMEEVDNEHLSTWMDCMSASTPESDMTPQER